MVCIVFVRGKIPDETMIEMAKEREIALLSTGHRMFSACGILYEKGLRGGGHIMNEKIILNYNVNSGDFTRAGEDSSNVKKKLKLMGFDPNIVRKVAIFII